MCLNANTQSKLLYVAWLETHASEAGSGKSAAPDFPVVQAAVGLVLNSSEVVHAVIDGDD